MDAPEYDNRYGNKREAKHTGDNMIDLNSYFGRTRSVDPAEPSLAPSDEDLYSVDFDLSTITGTQEGFTNDQSGYESISILTPDTTGRDKAVRSNSDFDDDQRKLSQRRADEVRSVFSDPHMWRYLDHFQLECLGVSDCLDPNLPVMSVRRDDPWMWFEREHDSKNDVVVKVEAAALSEYDVDTDLMYSMKNFVPGSNAVGVVHHCSPAAEESGVKPGMRVAAILQPHGTNARYFSMPASEVLPVPRHLDASDIACIATAYLPAFQALHHGRVRPYRYSRTCLQNRRILILGGEEMVAQATIRLAQLAGATDVYVCGPNFLRNAFNKHDAYFLDEDPTEWPEEIDGTMDVVVDYQFPQNFADVKATIARKGRLVCCSPSSWTKRNTSWWSDLTQFVECFQLSSVKRATYFDFRTNYKKNRYELKEDFQFLLTALTRRQIRPQIDRYVKLVDVPKVYRDIRSRPSTGSIICEPWRE